MLVLIGLAARADEIELLNGIKLRGKIVKESADSVTIKADLGGGKEMTWALKKIHAITLDGERRVVNERAARKPRSSSPKPRKRRRRSSSRRRSSKDADRPKTVTRTGAQVEAMVRKAGSTPPDWWKTVELDYPQTLDVSWPQVPRGERDEKTYPQLYISRIINPNPDRWRQGARLLHEILALHRSDRRKQAEIMERLGHVYGHLLADYPRAIFWWRNSAKAAGRLSATVAIDLADAYWKLGCKQMAVAALREVGADTTRDGRVIKLWSDIGELGMALSLAKQKIGTQYAYAAYRAAGDAYRAHGRYKDALGSYQMVLGVPGDAKLQKDIDKTKARARASMDSIKVFEALDLSKIEDGEYTGSGTGHVGDVHVEVAVRGGKIESVKVTQHRESAFYTSLTAVPEQIVQNQGLKGVDAVTGATQTSEAIINGTAQALASGM